MQKLKYSGENTIPPAHQAPPGSLVVMSLKGTEKTDLVYYSCLWLGVAFVAGYAIGHVTKASK